MPAMDGFEFIARFRQLPHCADVPIVIWTAKELTSQDLARLTRSASAIVAKGSLGASGLIAQLKPFLARTPPPLTPGEGP